MGLAALKKKEGATVPDLDSCHHPPWDTAGMGHQRPRLHGGYEVDPRAFLRGSWPRLLGRSGLRSLGIYRAGAFSSFFFWYARGVRARRARARSRARRFRGPERPLRRCARHRIGAFLEPLRSNERLGGAVFLRQECGQRQYEFDFSSRMRSRWPIRFVFLRFMAKWRTASGASQTFIPRTARTISAMATNSNVARRHRKRFWLPNALPPSCRPRQAELATHTE